MRWVWFHLSGFLIVTALFAVLTYFFGGYWSSFGQIVIFFVLYFGLHMFRDVIIDNYKKNPESKFWHWWETVRARVTGENRPK
jgi:hypothetical protein